MGGGREGRERGMKEGGRRERGKREGEEEKKGERQIEEGEERGGGEKVKCLWKAGEFQLMYTGKYTTVLKISYW